MQIGVNDTLGHTIVTTIKISVINSPDEFPFNFITIIIIIIGSVIAVPLGMTYGIRKKVKKR